MVIAKGILTEDKGKVHINYTISPAFPYKHFNLKAFDKNLFQTPLVFQYNKRDLAKNGIPILPVEKLEKSLNHQLKVPSFEASALAGINVVETMKKIISLTVSSLEEKLVIKG